jgi:cysteine desulfurase
MRRVYFDNNATTPLLPEVFDAMKPYLLEQYGNASSIHRDGQQARAAVDRARDSVARLLGSTAGEIVFASGGTEADNLALFGTAAEGDHIITSEVEHHAILHACNRLEQLGCRVTYLPVDGHGLVNPDDVRRALRPATKLITVMMANNETGVLQPVEEIGKIARAANVRFHTDAVQAAAKTIIDVNKIHCDLLSISGHKIHAPKGVGALYVRKGTALQPILYGGSHERSRRAGTENVPGIVALGKASEMAVEGLRNASIGNIALMRDRLEETLLSQTDSMGVNGAGAPRVPNTTNLYFDSIDGEALVIALDLRGLAVSGGAACSSGATEPSHVLTAMGLGPDRARASVRFSLGKQNTPEDLDYALALIPETVARLRALSPVYNRNKPLALSH